MANSQKFDIAVIGAGPGGYVAAIKGAQMGKRVALIEKHHLGGTCLNVGCIPSKALLSNASIFQTIKRAERYGIEVGTPSFDYGKMHTRKEQVVNKLRTNLEGLLRSNGITIVRGAAQFVAPKQLKVVGEDNFWIHAEKIIIATGSEPIDVPAFPCDHRDILDSTSALDLTVLPRSIAIVGGGYIGCEFASLFAAFGVKVMLIEALPTIVQMQGKEISAALTQAFKKQGIEIRSDTSVESIEKGVDGLTIHLNNGEALGAEKVIVAVGRRLNVRGLGLEKAGMLEGTNGVIEVNEKMETQVPGIYAIGDITAIAMLAHVASHQGIVAAANASGLDTTIHYHAIPSVIFTHPEIASVGLTPEEAQRQKLNFSIGTFPFQALGKAVASCETEGFAQILSETETGKILGAHVVGNEASTLIAEMTLAINNELTLNCVIDTIHAHPTRSEAWLEAAFLAQGTPLHFPPKKRAGG